jgi:hypothetical protein
LFKQVEKGKTTMLVGFTLKGIMPLIMHQDDVEASDTLSEWRKDPANKNRSVPGDDRSPAWTWQTYLYSDGEYVTMPSANLMVAIRQAGVQLILKKQKTFKEISQSGLLIPSEYLRFSIGEQQLSLKKIHAMREHSFAEQAAGVRPLGFRLFVKRANIGKNKHVRVRPRFDSWNIRGQIRVLVPEITLEILEKLFNLAGRVGLADWRPGCKTPGPYGMFEASLKIEG